MQKIPVRNYSNHDEITDYILIEDNPELKFKSILDSTSKFLMLSCVHLGQEKHFLFPTFKIERTISDPLYLFIRHVVEMPATDVKLLFQHIGLVANCGGVKKLIWRERCVLHNTSKEIHLDIPMFAKMELGS